MQVIACGITYTHREKFRSDVGVTYETAAVLTARQYPELTASEGGERSAAQSLMQSVAETLRRNVISASDWQLVRAANVARRLHAPLGTRISLHQHVRLTQMFVKVSSTSAAASIGLWICVHNFTMVLLKRYYHYEYYCYTYVALC
jgi:glycerol-3-phosphate O-acyltransferase / dihydroxyacetone phosphate acyltransferase